MVRSPVNHFTKGDAMNALLITVAIMGQTHVRISTATLPAMMIDSMAGAYYGTPCLPPRTHGRGLWWRYYDFRSPWERSVDNLRAARAAQPRPMPTTAEWATIDELDSTVEAMFEELKAAPAADKAVLRAAYLEMKRIREREKLKIVRKMHYRRKNYIAAN